jgi:hypothetical protein
VCTVKFLLTEIGWESVIGLIWLRIGSIAGNSEDSNETSDFGKDGRFAKQFFGQDSSLRIYRELSFPLLR